jgi:hypothetical protein
LFAPIFTGTEDWISDSTPGLLCRRVGMWGRSKGNFRWWPHCDRLIIRLRFKTSVWPEIVSIQAGLDFTSCKFCSGRIRSTILYRNEAHDLRLLTQQVVCTQLVKHTLRLLPTLYARINSLCDSTFIRLGFWLPIPSDCVDIWTLLKLDCSPANSQTRSLYSSQLNYWPTSSLSIVTTASGIRHTTTYCIDEYLLTTAMIQPSLSFISL